MPMARPTRKAAEVIGRMLERLEAWLAIAGACEKTL